MMPKPFWVIMISSWVTAFSLGVMLFVWTTPDFPDKPVVRHPQPTPTSSTAPVHPRPDPVKLIIQQNVNCWWPEPGYICTGRQYL